MAEYNVKASPYNAKGDGTTDDTSAIQNCFNACSTNGDGYVYIPSGTYMINAITSLQAPSNIKIVFNSKATLKAITTNTNTSCVLMINNVSNVDIDGSFATVMGDRDTNTYVGGEYGMCVKITDSTNVTIRNLIATKGYGDGFYVGTNNSGFCENVNLINCTADSNRRNGLSIISAKNMLVKGGEYKNTNGTNPQYGIDIEPNNGNNTIQNVNLEGVSTSNNVNGGLQVVPMFAGGGKFSVNVENFTSDSDLGEGIALIGGSPVSATEVYGKINIKDSLIVNPYTNGVYFQTWRNMPRADVSNVTVINPNQGNSANNQVSSAFVVYASPNDSAGNYGNINFENCGVIDNRTTSQTYAAYFMASDSTHNIQNVSIVDPFWEGLKTTLKGWIALPGNYFGTAKFTTPNVVNLSASQDPTPLLGQEIVPTAAMTLQFASSNSSIGNEFIVRNGAASGTVTVSVSTGDTIIHKGAAVTSIALTTAGMFVKIRAIGSNKYVVVEHNVA
jgi:hypothetical protein